MVKVILGYPGVGVASWVEHQPEGSVKQSTKFDIDELNALPETVTHYAAPLTEEALQQCADAKIAAVLFYPAPTALTGFTQRQTDEGLTWADDAEHLDAVKADLAGFRSNSVTRNRHIVLGRNETVLDYGNDL